MGRLSHLSVTLGFALKEFDRVVVVDWSCPEHSGKYAESLGAKVIYKPGETFFSGSKAKNLGAKHVTSEYIAFVDADSLCMPGLGDELKSLVSPNAMILSARNHDGSDVNDTMGFLVCRTDTFWDVGGFDESWVGWGHEDTHLRGKLALEAGLQVKRLSPTHKLGAIAHSNDMRETYREAPIKQTAVEGYKRLVNWFATKGVDYPEQAQEIAFKPHSETQGERL